MSAYLIEVDDSKSGVCYPTIVGPFSDFADATAFAEEAGMGSDAEGQGGYNAVHVICDETAETPEGYRKLHPWRFDAQVGDA